MEKSFEYIYIYIYIGTIYIYRREGAVVNGRSTAYHVLNLVLDLSQNLIKFLVFLYNSSLYLSVFVLEPLWMYS